jgi:protein ImuB
VYHEFVISTGAKRSGEICGFAGSKADSKAREWGCFEMITYYACLVAKEFPLQAMLRWRPELLQKPVAVLDGEPPFEYVCSLNNPALTLGIAPGMTKLEMELFPSAIVLFRSRAQESAARAALLECAGTFSPRVEDQSSDGCFIGVIDITGTGTLFGSPQALGESLLQRIKTLGIRASVAISSNFQAARCLARGRAGIRVVPQGRESEALAPLPLTVLDLSPEHTETFAMWGITTLGELGSLKETELIARLGQAGKELRLLARGESPHLFTAIEAGFPLEERIELDAPVELLDSLLFILGVMLDQLIVRAQSRILALASITLRLDLEGGTAHARTVQPALPNTDRKLWLKLIHLDLQAHPPPAAIQSLTLTAQPGSTSKVQLGLFSPQVPEPMRLDVTLARIRSIVGEGNVGQAVLQDTHHPDAFRVEPFTVASSSTGDRKPGSQRLAMRQLRPPELVIVNVRHRQPESFVFREKRYTVARAYGPWSSAGDWWKPTLWSLEQWDLVARAHDASWLCCCLTRDLTQERWQVEALYD